MKTVNLPAIVSGGNWDIKRSPKYSCGNPSMERKLIQAIGISEAECLKDLCGKSSLRFDPPCRRNNVSYPALGSDRQRCLEVQPRLTSCIVRGSFSISEIRCVSAIAYLLAESWCCLYKAPTFISHNTKEIIS